MSDVQNWRYDRLLDRMTGHDFPGTCGPGMDCFTRNEVELGARVALELDDDCQAWWILDDLRTQDLLQAGGGRDQGDQDPAQQP